MPNQILPISGLAETGLIEDTPSVALPPNAFSDVLNVRFKNNTITKFEADETLLSGLTGVVYAAEWISTLGKRYVVLTESGGNTTFTVYDDSWSVVASQGGTYTGVTGGEWQHTLFNGGYHIIFNNGNSTPVFLQDDISGVTELPGWDSYLVEETKLEFEYDGTTAHEETISVTLADGDKIKITRLPRNLANPIVAETVIVNSSVNGVLPDGTLADIGTISGVSTTGFTFTPEASSGGDIYRIAIVSDPVIDVTCGVIRAYGNLLVAGDLRESNGRTLTGTVRTSDVAAPGQIPQSWNPFRNGANTADEFTLASTGIIKDMAELQGVLYIYTDSSIHSVQRTNSAQIPFQVGIVTGNYGANNIGGVVEVDGKHIVYGSNDCFIFAGHPGSISSISSSRVRDFFRNESDIKIVRYNKEDELWFFTTSIIYVFDYRNNTWTKRSAPTSATTIAPGKSTPLFAASTEVKGANHPTNAMSNAYIERRRISLNTEYETETLVSAAFLVDGSDDFTVNMVPTNAPGDITVSLTDVANDKSFSIATDYKHDVRITGRFLNYRISHTTSTNFNLTGLQLEVGQGGRR